MYCTFCVDIQMEIELATRYDVWCVYAIVRQQKWPHTDYKYAQILSQPSYVTNNKTMPTRCFVVVVVQNRFILNQINIRDAWQGLHYSLLDYEKYVIDRVSSVLLPICSCRTRYVSVDSILAIVVEQNDKFIIFYSLQILYLNLQEYLPRIMRWPLNCVRIWISYYFRFFLPEPNKKREFLDWSLI